MNKEKIEKALKQIDIALESINSDNFPEFTNADLDYDGFSFSTSGSKVYNNTAKAYQLLDNISYELNAILEEE